MVDFVNSSDLSLSSVVNITSQPGQNLATYSVSIIAFFVLLFVILETLGNFLLLSMIIYEKYGMDPQKRTVSNQLLSNNCVMWLIYNLSIMPLFMVHRVFRTQSKLHLTNIFTMG